MSEGNATVVAYDNIPRFSTLILTAHIQVDAAMKRIFRVAIRQPR